MISCRFIRHVEGNWTQYNSLIIFLVFIKIRSHLIWCYQRGFFFFFSKDFIIVIVICSGVKVEHIILRGVNVLLTLLWTWVSLKIKKMFKYNALQSCNATNSDLSKNVPVMWCFHLPTGIWQFSLSQSLIPSLFTTHCLINLVSWQ